MPPAADARDAPSAWPGGSPGPTNGSGPADASASWRALGTLVQLVVTDPRGLADELPELLSALQETCGQASDAITKRYFQYAAPVTWVQEG